MATEVTMIPHGFGPRLREDGSIDFEAYRAEAARSRSRERDRIVWEVLLPALMRSSALLFASALGRVGRSLARLSGSSGTATGALSPLEISRNRAAPSLAGRAAAAAMAAVSASRGNDGIVPELDLVPATVCAPQNGEHQPSPHTSLSLARS
jgi:hypothetical protein